MNAQRLGSLEIKRTGEKYPYEAKKADIPAILTMVDSIQQDVFLVLIDKTMRAHLLQKEQSTLTLSEKEALRYAQIFNEVDNIVDREMEITEKEAALIKFFKNGCPAEIKVHVENYLIEEMKRKIDQLRQNIENHEIDLDDMAKQIDIYAALNVRTRRVYAVTKRTKQAFAIECVKFYTQIAQSKKIPDQQLVDVHAPVVACLMSTATTMDMTEEIRGNYCQLSVQDETEEFKAEMPSISGNDSSHWCYVFPALPDGFPEGNEHVEAALDILEAARDEVYDLIKPIPSFQIFLDIKDLNFRNFHQYCQEFKQKLDDIYASTTRISKPLSEILKKEQIIKHLKLLQIHFTAIWETAAMPAFVLYAQILFGEDQNGI